MAHDHKNPNESHNQGRRQFLKGAVGAVVAGSALAACQTVAAKIKRPLGVETPIAKGSAMPFLVGAAEADITPTWDVGLMGFGPRTAKAGDKYQPLKVRAMSISDGKTRYLLMMADVCYIDERAHPKNILAPIRAQLKTMHGLDPEQIFMIASHTHCAPLLKDEKFAALFAKQAVAAADEAVKSEREARLFFGRGRCDFGISRRALDAEGRVTHISIAPYSPVDREVTVLKAVGRDGRPIALAFSYSCHPTTWGGLKMGGDYPGFAQIEMSRRLGGMPALFLQGTGADVKPNNPDPKKPYEFLAPQQAPLADPERFGNQLAESVTNVLQSPMEEITGRIRIGKRTVDLPVMIATPATPSKDPDAKLDPAKKFSGPERRMARLAEYTLASLNPDGTFKKSQGWDMTVIRIGDRFIQVGLGGEICCPVGLRIKDELRGNMVMVSGYTNANSGYFPSQTQIAAGGYEVFSNLHYKPYTPEAEDILVYGVMQTIKELA
ncbi:hypothetical protein LLG95_08660 [bacterium]|nr:hypothetical protein [bacterium]